MKLRWLPLVTVLVLCGCATAPVSPRLAITPDACEAFFPQRPLRLVYRIDAAIPFQAETTLIGVTALEPRSRSLHVVLLTPEGATVLDARQTGGETEVLQALPPFDRAAFADGVLDDVSLVLLAPPGEPVAAPGRCTWTDSEEQVALEIAADGSWNLTRRRHGRTLRTVRAAGVDAARVPHRLKIEAAGPLGYTLRFSLIEAPEPAASP
jgi:hypothetical protein